MHWCIPQENKIAQDSPSNFANQHLLHQILGYFLTIGFTEQRHWSQENSPHEIFQFHLLILATQKKP